MHERPDLVLGAWIDHPDHVNCIFAALRTGGKTSFRFHTRETASKYANIKHYGLMDRERFIAVLDSFKRLADTLRSRDTASFH